MKESKLWLGDCLDLMKNIPDGSIDFVCCDLPYGVTACKWDSIVDLKRLWAEYKRVAKGRAAIALFGMEPFSSTLVCSNLAWFKYDWVWDKQGSTCFVHAKHRPLGTHERVLIFGKGRTTYNPQMSPGLPYDRGGLVDNSKIESCPTKKKLTPCKNVTGLRYPKTILVINNGARLHAVHPTQKPVTLLEYFIKTYSLPGDTVLDNCMGSGTTGIACARTGRNFIGIEKDEEIFKIAERRIRTAERTGIIVGREVKATGFFRDEKE